MDDGRRSEFVSGHFGDSFYTSVSHRTPPFSLPTEHGLYRGLGSLYVDSDLSPRLSTSLPGDQGLSVDPIMAQPMVYQRPSIGLSSHSTTFYTSRGYHVESPCSTRHALPQSIPQGTLLHNHNTQVCSTMNAHFPYAHLWYYNTEVYHGPLGQHHIPVVRGLFNNPMDVDFMQPRCVTSPTAPDAAVHTNRKPPRRDLPCPVLGCSSSLGRPQDRNRHILTHLPDWIHCPDLDCSWRGDRPSDFKKHRSRDHPSSGQEPSEDQYKTYDPLPLVVKIVWGTLSIQDANTHALLMVRKKSSELGIKKMYENPWGRKGRRTQRRG